MSPSRPIKYLRAMLGQVGPSWNLSQPDGNFTRVQIEQTVWVKMALLGTDPERLASFLFFLHTWATQPIQMGSKETRKEMFCKLHRLVGSLSALAGGN